MDAKSQVKKPLGRRNTGLSVFFDICSTAIIQHASADPPIWFRLLKVAQLSESRWVSDLAGHSVVRGCLGQLVRVVKTLLEVTLGVVRDVGVVKSSLEASSTEGYQYGAHYCADSCTTYTLVGSLPSSA